MADSLKQRIELDMKTALLGGDRFRGEVLRGLKAAILNEEIATKNREAGLSDDAIEKVIVREVKKRKEAATLYAQNNRAELAENEDREAAILGEYLPEQLDEAELNKIVVAKVAELDAIGDPKKMGAVIGAVKSAVGNTADGALLAKLVRDAINSDKL